MVLYIRLPFFLLIFLISTIPAHAQAPDGGSSKPTPVIVSDVEEKEFADKVEALGTLKANESVEVTTTVTERVTKINFDDNQHVKQGDILVEMDAAEEFAELSEQESFLAESERQVERLEPLVKKGAASESDLDARRREALGATARIKAIQSRIDQRIIKAPYDGILGLRNISVSALAQPGTIITTIDDISVMKLDFSVPEVFLASLKVGVEIKAETEAYPNEAFTGKITSVDSRIDPVTRSIQARALIDNKEGKLKPGLLMLLELQKNPRKALVVPEESLITNGSNQFVLVIIKQDGRTIAERRKVTLGARQYGEVEVLDGLIKGERVVTHGTLRVMPGGEVEITATEKNGETLRELLDQKEKQTDQDGDEAAQ